MHEQRLGRTKGATFEQALALTEELTQLPPAKIKSLHFIMSAEGFRWKGSREGTKARLMLLDGKSLSAKRRRSVVNSLCSKHKSGPINLQIG